MLFSLLIVFFFILCIFNRATVISSSAFSIELWIKSIFPSLFISFMVVDLLSNTTIPKYLSKILNPIFKFLFHFRYEESSYIFLMSLLSGTPTSSKIVSDAYDNNQIDLEEANHLLKFNTFASPFFLLAMTSTLFTNTLDKIYFFIAHYSANILYGVIISQFYNKEKKLIKSTVNSDICLADKFANSVTKNMNILISVLGFVTFFTVLIDVSLNYIALDELSIGLIKLTTEQITGINYIFQTNINKNLLQYLVLMFITFCGLTTFLEIKIMYKNLEFKSFLLARIMTAVLVLILFIILKLT